MEFVGDVAVGLYMNSFSLVMVLVLFSLCFEVVQKHEDADRLFFLLCAVSGVYSLCGIMYFLTKGSNNFLSRPVMILYITLGRIAVLALLVIWILFVDFKLNKSRDHLKRRYKFLWWIIGAIFVLYLINFFTGIIFTVDEDLNHHYSPLFYVILCINLGCFFLSCETYFRYKKEEGVAAYFSILPFIVPVAVGAFGEILVFYAAETAGFAVGLIFLYFSMVRSWQFDDCDTFFLNNTYFRKVCESVRNGRDNIKGAAIFTCENEAALRDILKEEMPKSCEIIRLGTGRFVFLSSRGNKSFLQSLASMIAVEAESYDRDHPGNKISFGAEYAFPDKEAANPAEWLEKLERTDAD